MISGIAVWATRHILPRMITPNIEALRKTQQSIANPAEPFHMGDWYCCIAYHACKANQLGDMLYTYVAEFLGVPVGLFLPDRGSCSLSHDRDAAIARIQALIDAAATEPAPDEALHELVGA